MSGSYDGSGVLDVADFANVGKLLEWGAKGLRFVRGHKVVWRARDIAVANILRTLHLNVVHHVRCLSAATTPVGNPDQASLIASALCTHFREAMCTLLELKPNQLHCCIKLIAPKSDPDDDQLGTWVRSTPSDDRPTSINPQEDFHRIDRNSVWSAFYGISDGSTHWRKTNCFACNDLVKHANLFRCDRESWQNFYRSTLVFAINRARKPDGSEVDRLGFLAFDSPSSGSFRGVPDIFAYRENLAAFRDLLWASSAFHLGAICADLLGTSLAFNVERPIGTFLQGESDAITSIEPRRLECP